MLTQEQDENVADLKIPWLLELMKIYENFKTVHERMVIKCQSDV